VLLARAAVGAPISVPSLPKSAVTGDVKVTADEVTYDPTTGRVTLRGNAVVRRGNIVIRARSAEYDPTTGEVRATGNVLLTDPTRVVSADAVRAVLGGAAEAEGVLAFVKDQPADLSGLCSVEEAARAGHNRLSFSSPSLRADEAGRMKLRGARLSVCDCPGGRPPAWEITASEADVIPGDRAILHWPVLRIAPPFVDRTVPVFIAPWLYVPLSERQSGLLIPTYNRSVTGGVSIGQPLYLTLGRSADATITAIYAFGLSRDDVAKSKPSVRGPAAVTELRWAPAERAEGRAELTWLHDLDAEPGGASGDRFGLVLGHRQQIGDAGSLQARLQLASDPLWFRDQDADALVRSVSYRRSDVLGSVRAGPAVAEGVASYLQPFDPTVVSTVLPYGRLGADRSFSSRWGAAAVSLVPAGAGPLQLSGRLGVARFAPVVGLGDTGRDAVGRLAVTRGDARAELAVPLLLGDAVTLAPWVRGAALGYAPEGGETKGIAWAVAGATVESEVSRRFGELRHTVTPRLQWRAATRPAGDPLAFPAYDHLDRSTSGLLTATPGDFQQLRASLETRLEAPGRTVLRAELGQETDLRAGRLAETFGAIGFGAPHLNASASARVLAVPREDPAPPPRIPSAALDRFTELRAGFAAEDGRGNGVQLGYAAIGAGGSGRLVAGLDPLFDPRAAPALDASGTANIGLRAAIASARLGYDANVYGRAAYVPACTGTGERRVSSFHLQQHKATFSWDSPCHCFRLSAEVRLDDCGSLGYGVMIDLAGLGSHGSAFGSP